MGDGEWEIFFKSANPGVKRIDEEKKAPSNRLLKTLAVGRRANARGSAALKSERSGKIASLLSVKDASFDEFRANVVCNLVGKRTKLNDKVECSNWGHLVGAVIGIAVTNIDTTNVRTTKASQCRQRSVYLIDDVDLERRCRPSGVPTEPSVPELRWLDAVTSIRTSGSRPYSMARLRVSIRYGTRKSKSPMLISSPMGRDVEDVGLIAGDFWISRGLRLVIQISLDLSERKPCLWSRLWLSRPK